MKHLFYLPFLFSILLVTACTNVPKQVVSTPEVQAPIPQKPGKSLSKKEASKNVSRRISVDNLEGIKPSEQPVTLQNLVRYDEIFKKSREVLKQQDPKTQLRISKSVSESALIEYLQKNPESLTANQEDLLKIIKEESKTQKDPTKHLRLIPPPGTSGYSNLKIYVSHPYYAGKKVVPAANLVKAWNDFLKQAKKKIMLNVFDFDLEEIATTLAAKAHRGVQVTVGIDSDTIKHRDKVAYIYDFLKRNNVNVVAVNSTNLNHQKMAVIDWDEPATTKVLFSSGNLTQSCLGPEGDLKEIAAAKRPASSVPNANHVMTMDSWLLGNLVFNELTKTMDEKYRYRGAEYPILGSYQITGPGVNPETLEAYPENSLIISFSPEGGYKDINRNIIGHFIRASDGPIRMIQFAFSAEEVTEALLEKAQEQKDKFNFLSVGDTPFAMQTWSQFLKMSGLERIKNNAGENEYYEPASIPFKDVLGNGNFSKLRSNIRIAPSVYKNSSVTIDDKKYPISAKIHHKILSAGNFAILGTSFNFSKNAQKNNEQILVFKSKKLASVVDGMTRWLSEKSSKSVFEEALKRNSFVKNPDRELLIIKNQDSSGTEDESDESDIEDKQAS